MMPLVGLEEVAAEMIVELVVSPVVGQQRVELHMSALLLDQTARNHQRMIRRLGAECSVSFGLATADLGHPHNRASSTVSEGVCFNWRLDRR